MSLSRPETQRVAATCLVILTVLAVAAALKWLAPVMIPFVLAFFISQLLSPLIRLLMTYAHLPRAGAVLATLLVAVLGFVGVLSLASASVAQLGANAAAYQAKAAELMQTTAEFLPLEAFGVEDAAVAKPLEQLSLSTIGSVLLGTTNAILELLSNSLLVLIFLLFMLLGPGSSPSDPKSTWAQIDGPIKRYLYAKAMLSAATGLLVGLVLYALGIDLALVFGLFAFMFNFIPNIGSVIATLLPLPVVIMSPDISTTTAALAILIPGAIQFSVGNLIEPRLLGHSLDLNPVAILLNLIVWGMLWGVVGMLLATPILVVIKILCGKIEETHFIARLLANEPDQALA